MRLERIGNIAQFINGAPFKPEDWCENGMKIIRIQNLTDPNKPYNKTNRIVDKKYIVTKGDVLVSWSATIDVFTWEDEDALLNQHIFKVIFDKSKVDKSYFIIALKETINELTKFAHGATMKHVVKGDFDNHKIPLPPIPVQLHIANLLGKAENLITQRKQSIALLDDFLKSTYCELFNKYEGTKIQRLESIASITSGLTKGKKYEGKITRFLPYMRVANVQDGFLNLQEIKEIEATEDEINRFNLKFGDLLLTEGGDPDKLGRGTTWKNQIQDCIFQNHIFRVRINDIEKINPVFLSYQTGSIYGKKYFLKTAKQTTGIASINSTQLKKFPAFIPPFELQTQFAQIVDKPRHSKSNTKAVCTSWRICTAV